MRRARISEEIPRYSRYNPPAILSQRNTSAESSRIAASPTPTSAAQTMDASAEPSAAARPAAALCSEIRSTRNVSGPGVMESNRHSPAKANRVTAVMGSIVRVAAA